MSARVGETAALKLASEIPIENVTLKLQNGDAAPGFLTLENGELPARPVPEDVGSYDLHLEWTDPVEFISVPVTENIQDVLDVSTKPGSPPDFDSLNLYSKRVFSILLCLKARP